MPGASLVSMETLQAPACIAQRKTHKLKVTTRVEEGEEERRII